VPEIGLFPLGMVLLPTERVPLHVFEPRYRELIGECLDEEREFGLVLADDQGLRDVGTRAGVVEVLQEFEDGRLNILVEGRERFRLVELTVGRSFQTGEVEIVEDEAEDDPPTRPERERALELFRRLAETAEAEVDEPEGETDWLSFELAARIDFGVELKQELLELRSERARIRRLSELMERAAQAIAVERDVRERASGNGKVSLP
jgi:Lon protease-like protein